ncbi:O-methyltransferase family 2 [Penicillium robsamsonii]|uniref:O-methyltransferase family 2 n=1 Tax=Penicillium robsamsonii TaxID=1792511 RepID=UPI002548A794|nr:O-methyltransferase family 2 [Penicillium robsamsonii]KAJ5825051.1 O-methyltransferase family 2 [Penicillium robsamsonii]
MTQNNPILSQIIALTGSAQTQDLDEQARSEALDAARGLVGALESHVSPVERIIQDVVMHSQL